MSGKPSIGALIEQAQKTHILDLSRRALTEIPPNLSQLTHLRFLDLSSNRLKALPDSLGQLKQLVELNLSGNELVSLPESLFGLGNLEYLNLSRTELTSLPESIGALAKLKGLDLSGCNLRFLPESLGQLTFLRILDVSDNDLVTLPKSLTRLTGLAELYLHGNEALELPLEFLGPTLSEVTEQFAIPASPGSILNYYFLRQSKGRPLNEARLTVVGSAGVGKTSIVRRLISDRMRGHENTTHGIEITDWTLQLKNGEQIRLHIWDFGGQEIMHSTFQVFLTTHSLYLLVLSGRASDEDDAHYWLKMIEIFGDESPVIVVLNQIHSHRFDLNRRALVAEYPMIRAFIETDSADGTGIQQLQEAIAQEAETLPRYVFPESWYRIKERLATLSKNFLSLDEFRDALSEDGVIDLDEQKTLAAVLHALGTVVNFSDDARLQDVYVLDPTWLTNGIYGILSSQKARQQNGEVRLIDVADILDLHVYPPRIHRYLFDLMKRFELCFSFSDDETHYLIPELLEALEPPEVPSFNQRECLIFEYHYDFLPASILPRFITRTHVLSEGLPRWRNGVVLRFESNQALVKADFRRRKVLISITGPSSGRRSLLGIIRSDFERIHRGIPKLRVEEMVPLPDSPDVLISYRELIGLEQNRIQRFPKLVNDQIVEFSVQELLSGVDLEDAWKSSENQIRQARPVKLFCSYSHKDEALFEEFEVHLKLMQRTGLIELWHDRMIEAGDDWKREVDHNLQQAEIIVLLVSADYLASDYSYDKEMLWSLQRHASGDAYVIPIILRAVPWQRSAFRSLQALPKDGVPVTSWPDRDSAWVNVVEGLEGAIRRIREGKKDKPETLLISSVSLENIRCFENLELSFSSGESVRRFVLLFGDNGVGKSSLLRSIALGLCDATTATALMETLPGTLLRRGSDRGQITIEFISSTTGAKWKVETVLRTENEMVVVEQTSRPDFPRAQIFACGYGAGRLRFGTQDYPGYSLKNSLSTLFNYESSLQNPELAFRRIESQGIKLNELTSAVDAILMLQSGDTSIDSSGIRVRGPWGDFTPLGGLGDGFQATLGWIADLFGWALFYNKDSIQDGLEGIVLIDEIEQHLHPSWQREIVRLLHQQFPGIQFIATSHSPMSALGTTALPESTTQVVRLRQMDDAVESATLEIPKGQRADQVLTSPLFGLFSASGFDVAAQIERYTELASRKTRTSAEEAELIELGARLESTLGPFRSDLERRIDESVREAMHKEVEDLLKSGKLTEKALDLQVRHRLKNFLGEGISE